ncbi:MAG: hypothetical protein ACFN0W_06225, partial [Propionibacterium acidifaciens]
FWDVPAIRDVVKILFDVEYQSDSSYQLLLRFCGLSLELPDPFDKHRNEKAITRRMTEVKTQVKALLDAGWEVYTADEVRLEHEAETRRMQLPKGQRTKLSVNRQKTSQSFFGALPRPAKKSRRTRPSRTRTPSRQSSRWNDPNAKPRPARSRSSWTTPDSTTRKH